MLCIIQAYTMPGGMAGPRPWLKEFVVNAIVHLGAKRGVFTDYDLAPSLFGFRGVKMFAMISQEALGDMNRFFESGLIEKMLLSTQHYAPIEAVRLCKGGLALMDSDTITDADREAVQPLIRCTTCGRLLDFAVSRESEPTVHLVMNRVCDCMTGGQHRTDDDWEAPPEALERLDDFFSLGSVSYRARPFFLRNRHGR